MVNVKGNQKITNQTRSTLYHELYDYIQNGFDARPSTTVKVIETLPSVIESLVKQIEGGATITTRDQLSPIPKTIDVLY